MEPPIPVPTVVDSMVNARYKADRIEAISFTVSRPELSDVEKAIAYSEELSLVAAVIAIRKRAKLVITKPHGIEEVARLREALVDRVFHILRTRSGGFDVAYINWDRKPEHDMWNIFSEGKKRMAVYVATVKGLEGLPRDVTESILKAF